MERIETSEGILTINVRMPNLSRLDAFMRLACAGDLLALKVFPNAKEISESMAAFAAVRFQAGNPEAMRAPATVVVVGDGATPRTAAMFAFRTRWNVISIDPALRLDPRWSAIKRLTIFPGKIEDWPGIETEEPVVVVAVHSHAPLEVAWEKVRTASRKIAVAIPCCVSQELPFPPVREFEDFGIFSPKRLVRVWETR